MSQNNKKLSKVPALSMKKDKTGTDQTFFGNIIWTERL
jgi:hypothetical protein